MVMLPVPSNIKWTDKTKFNWDSESINDEKWHLVKVMKTPQQLACMDEIKGKIEWKGNFDAECKFVYLRDDK
jgi:hypothetical protein